jgi:hypothetical protein
MDLRSIATYLSMKDIKAREIYADMNDTLGTDCIGYSTVTKYRREKVSRSRCLTRISSQKLKRSFINEAILGAPEECPFHSLHQIAKRILIQMSTVQSSGQFFAVSNRKHSMGSPLALTEPKQVRAETSQDLLQVLRLAKHHAWRYIVTLDEVWFDFSNPFDRIWLPHDELLPSFPKQTIASQKLMITVV